VTCSTEISTVFKAWSEQRRHLYLRDVRGGADVMCTWCSIEHQKPPSDSGRDQQLNNEGAPFSQIGAADLETGNVRFQLLHIDNGAGETFPQR
jgi:hypothetical protein